MQSESRVKPHLFAQIILLIAFLGLVTYVSFKFGPAITRLMSHPERFKEFVNENGSASALLYILIQIAHVIIVLIPGRRDQPHPEHRRGQNPCRYRR